MGGGDREKTAQAQRFFSLALVSLGGHMRGRDSRLAGAIYWCLGGAPGGYRGIGHCMVILLLSAITQP